MSINSQTTDNNNDIYSQFDAKTLQELVNSQGSIEKVLAEKKLIEFMKIMWSSIDKNPYVHGWHLDAIAEHLEAVYRGEIKRLLINIPPRHCKSILCAVAFPAWVWTKDPSVQFLYATYAQNLTIRDSVKCRDLISSDKYRAYWGDKFYLKDDQNTKIKFINDKQGIRFATSIGGTVTGEGGDIIVVDDPNNPQENTEIARNNVIYWYDEVLSTRLNNPDSGAFVVIQQRVHQKDLSGHIMEKYGANYDTLVLPSEYEEGRKFYSTIGWQDPREEEGDLLWADRIPQHVLEDAKQRLGSYGYAGQYQQRPAPKAGGIIPINQFRRFTNMPDMSEVRTISLSIDTAYKEDQINDPSCLQVWYELHNLDMYLVDVLCKKMNYPTLKKHVMLWIDRYAPNETLIEDRASGIALLQDLKAEPTYKRGLVSMNPHNESKLVRMENEASAIDSGMVFIPEQKDWVHNFLDECSLFPNGNTKDQVDAMSQYLKRRRLKNRKANIDQFKMISQTGSSYWLG